MPRHPQPGTQSSWFRAVGWLVILGLLGTLVALVPSEGPIGEESLVTGDPEVGGPASVSPALRKKSSSYRGYQHWTNQTVAARTVIETPFARAQVHTVRLESGAVVDDWLWFDEGDAVNVLVRRKAVAGASGSSRDSGGGKFVVFEQRKYGFEGLSYAPVGGFIDDGEAPLAAAKRELREELGLASDRWLSLGSYRVAANRGAGVVHCFLAADAYSPPTSPSASASSSPAFASSGARVADLEAQASLELTRAELLAALLAGKFKEVKWTATVALALLSER